MTPLTAPVRRPRRALLGAAASLAALLAGAAVAVPGAAAETVPGQPAELRVGTYNIQANRTPEVFQQAVEAVLPRVDVLGLQEIGGRKKGDVMASLYDDGWSYFRGKPGEQSPILWDHDRFEFEAGSVPQLAPATYVGYERPGFDPTVAAQYATVVRLKDRLSGERMTFINTHLVAGAVMNGRRYPGRPRTFSLYRNTVAALTDLVARHRANGRVFVMGDFNINWKVDNRVRKPRLVYVKMARIGMTANWTTGGYPLTLGTRLGALLDQVYSSTKAARSSIEFDVPFSDHFPAVATYVVPTVS